MTLPRIRPLWIILPLLAGVAIFLLTRPREADVAIATKRPLIQSVVATGRVATPARIEIGSQITAIVTAVNVREGDRVTLGQELVRLKSDDARAAVEQARAALAEAQARARQLDAVAEPVSEQALRQAEANLRVAKAELERAQRLVAQGFFSPSRLDDAKRNHDNAVAAVASTRAQRESNRSGGTERVAAQARITQAQAALEAAQARQALLSLAAPVDAMVLTRDVEPGDVAQAGKVLLTLAENGETRIYATVDEKNLRHLKSGGKAQAVADAFPGQPFTADLYYIAPGVDALRGTVEVRLRVPEPPAFLRPDMTVSVETIVGTRDAALVLPAEAVRDADGNAPWVLLAQDGVATRVAVKPGLRGVGLIEIVEGLAEGAQAILPGAPVLEGDSIRAKPPREKSAAGIKSVPQGMVGR